MPCKCSLVSTAKPRAGPTCKILHSSLDALNTRISSPLHHRAFQVGLGGSQEAPDPAAWAWMTTAEHQKKGKEESSEGWDKIWEKSEMSGEQGKKQKGAGRGKAESTEDSCFTDCLLGVGG